MGKRAAGVVVVVIVVRGGGRVSLHEKSQDFGSSHESCTEQWTVRFSLNADMNYFALNGVKLSYFIINYYKLSKCLIFSYLKYIIVVCR
jgi:hypothetical protein